MPFYAVIPKPLAPGGGGSGPFKRRD